MRRASVYAALSFATAVVLFPLLWVVKIALTGDTSANLLQSATAPSSQYFAELFAGSFTHALLNSFVVSIVATLIGLGFATTGAYAFSRFRFRGRQRGLDALLVSQMFPGLLMSVPLYLLLNWLHLLGSLAGVVLVYSTVSVPFSIWLLKGSFDSIPSSLLEAARLDGASDTQIFYRICLPLIRPGLAVTALYSFMGSWNEYILAATFLNRQERYTAPVVLKGMVGAFSTDWGPFAAGSLIVSLPVILIFFGLQRHLVSGLLAGAVKE